MPLTYLQIVVLVVIRGCKFLAQRQDEIVQATFERK